MRGRGALLLLFGAGAFVGAAVGVAVGTAWSQARLEVARDELAAAREAAQRLEAELREAESRRGPERSRVQAPTTAADGGEPAAVPTAAAPATSDVADDGDASTPEQRAARVRELIASQPVWFERGDGDAALAALRELAALVPEGREAAMQLALAINADVRGEGRLELSDVTFYTGLADRNVRALMGWAIAREETPAEFRVMAAYSLPWTQDAAQTREQFAEALRTEKSAQVQQALVANLGRLRDPEAERLLGGILADPSRDGALRAQVAAQLATTTDEGIVRALEIAAEKDGDAQVRDAARAALVARDPPASGYLVTGTLPESQAAAAGLRAGDVLVSYDGQSTRTLEALREAATAAEGRETVDVIVIRDGEEVRMSVRPGRLGVFGRAVQADER
jgi:hypothetical protein